MQVHAIYENGRLRFQQPIRLKVGRIELDINIPDNCIETEPPAAPESAQEHHRRQSPTRERLDAILGPWRGKLGSISPQEVKEMWHQHLEEKYLGSKR